MDREDWQDACKAATSSSVRGGGRTGAAKSRDGYTLRPEAGSTSKERFRNELRLATGGGFLDGVIFNGMPELKNAERHKTRLDLNYNPNVEQLKKNTDKIIPEITEY